MNIFKRKLLSVGAWACLVAAPAAAAPKNAAKTKPVPPHTHLSGYLGERIDACIRGRVMSEDESLLAAPFRQQNETQAWQSEFWGKWTLGAIASYRYNGDPELLQEIRNGVELLLSAQLPDGYIGNYAPEAQLTNWDVWGRKYTLLGLLAYYDLSGNKKVLEAARHLADHLLTQIPSRKSIVEAGLYRGMPPSSILEPMVALYDRTGDKRYLDFAEYIVAQWETERGPRLIGKALEGVPVSQRFVPDTRQEAWWSWDNGQKAYEMMSCYDGLLDLYKITGKPEYLEAVRKSVQNILDEEINIAGSGSAFECFYGGRARQTLPTYHTMETCVTMTWMKLCRNLLELTHDPLYADQIERTAYNALCAALKNDASQIAKYSPLEGARSVGEEQCGMHVNCCNSNGPRAFAMLPEVAVTQADDNIYINLYGESNSTVRLPGGEVILTQTTTYPEEGDIEIAVSPRKAFEFGVSLRIPAWSRVTMVSVNGESIGNIRPGSYLDIRRRWTPDDKITLRLDMRGRLVELDGCQAIERGPVVLARDSRFADGYVDETAVVQATDGYVTLLPVEEKPEKMWMAFTAPMVMGTDLEGEFAQPRQIALCDFASAGNTWNKNIRYRVWLRKTLNTIFDR